MKNKVSYYNIYLYGKTQSVAELQKEYSFTNGKIDSNTYLRANDAFEYAVRLTRKDKDILKTLDKIIWQLKQCKQPKEKHYLYNQDYKGDIVKDLDENEWIEIPQHLFLLKSILELNFVMAIHYAKETKRHYMTYNSKYNRKYNIGGIISSIFTGSISVYFFNELYDLNLTGFERLVYLIVCSVMILSIGKLCKNIFELLTGVRADCAFLKIKSWLDFWLK